MKFIITLLILSLSFTAFNQLAFNAAENGLLIKQRPDTLSSTVGKLKFGEEVQIIERTDSKLTVVNNGNKIEARWYKITSIKNKSLTGYVFSGYLTNEPLSKKHQIQLNGFKLTISESSKEAFESRSQKIPARNFLDESKCLEQGLIDLLSEKEVEIKLANNTSMILKKEVFDDQFFGYTFIHYDSARKLYFLWENWLEAGHPIMIDGSNGSITEVIGSDYSVNQQETLMAIFAEDIGAGWTPNGVQLFKINPDSLEQLFSFNPRDLLNENWGVIDLKWEDDSTILIECVVNNVDGGYLTIYKKLKFEKE